MIKNHGQFINKENSVIASTTVTLYYPPREYIKVSIKKHPLNNVWSGYLHTCCTVVCALVSLTFLISCLLIFFSILCWQLSLAVDNLPSVEGSLQCVFSAMNKDLTTDATRTAHGVSCTTPRNDMLPDIPQNQRKSACMLAC